MQQKGSRLSRIDIALTVILFLISLLVYMGGLFRSPLVYGIDGPYYLIQVQSILRSGVIKYTDPPLSFYLFSILTLMFGDATFSIKLGTALLCSATVLPAYFLIKNMTHSLTASASSALFASLSPGLISMSGEFLKNAMGIPFLLSFIYFSYRILSGDESRNSKILFVAFFLLTGLTHILDTGVALLFLLLEVAIASLSGNRNSRFLKFSLLFLAGILSLGVISYLSMKGYTIDITKGFVFIEQFIKSLEFQPFLDFRDGFRIRFLSYVFVALGFILSYCSCKKGRWENAVVLTGSSIVLLCLAFPMLPPQWAMRFELMVFVPGFIIAGNLVAFFERDLDQMIVSVIMLGFVVLFQSFPTFNRIGPTLNPLQYRDLLEMSRFIPPGSSVTAPTLPWRYWIEYLFDSRNVGPIPPANETIYLIADNMSPLPMPGPRLLYSGKALNLYFVTAPRKHL